MSAAGRRLKLFVLMGALGMALLTSAARADEPLIEYNIPAHDLSDALNQFATQSRLQLVYPPDLVAHLSTAGLKGRFSANAALELLLQGSDIEYEFVATKTLVLRKKSAGNTVSDNTKDSPLDEVVVTGTHLHGVTPGSSPLTTYDRDYFELTGAGTVEAFLSTVPQNFASTGGQTLLTVPGVAAQNTSRGAAVDLRGLGPGSTLVLLNGHRLAPSGFDGSFVDVSLIPLSALERVEMVTDGASAIYGADAVGGAVNFVLRKNFSGAETAVQGDYPTRGGAASATASQLLGKSWQSGNVMLAYEFNHSPGLDGRDRSFVPDLGGPFRISPAEKRNSGLFTVNQDLSDRVSLEGMFFASHRAFVQDSAIVGVGEELDRGHARQVSGVVGINAKLAHDWHASGSFDYARESDEDSAQLIGTPAANFITVSQTQSLELNADGPIARISGGLLRGSLGASFRHEKFGNESASTLGGAPAIGREGAGAYLELLAPLVGESNGRTGLRRLELSAAARYDRYANGSAGIEPESATTPKIGLLWSPFSTLNVRGSFGRSFRVPPLAQLDARSNTATLATLSDSSAPLGYTNTYLLSGGNRTLRPERAEVTTFGVDYKGTDFPLDAQATYFHIRYRDRIANPPVVGSPFFLFNQLAALAPFVNLKPSAADLAAVQNQYRVVDFSNPGSGAAQAIFDDRFQNIGVVTASGLDATATYRIKSGVGEFSPFVAATYLRELNNQAAATTASVNLINTIFNPVSLRLRAGTTWVYRHWQLGATYNFVRAYQNNLTVPVSDIGSWETVDLHAAYTVANLNLALTVRNVTDRAPPTVTSTGITSNLGFDPTNASPLGRVIALRASWTW